jgi:5-methylcytosine-specific restriction endonuclease McrA
MTVKAICTGHENRGICVMCGGELRGRRTVYCSGECHDLYLGLFFWPWASDSAMRRCNHKCQRCGVTGRGLGRLQRQAGGWVDYRFRLEVHHVIPLNGELRTWHRLNVPANLLVVCHECHVLLHTPSYWRARERLRLI